MNPDIAVNPDQEKSDPSRSTVLLIGCSTYPRSNLTPVPGAKNNLAKLRAAFEDHELWGLRRGRVISEPDPTRFDMLDSIGTTYGSSQRGGIFVLYFAGHAQLHDGMLYLAPHDTGNIANPPASMVSMVEIFQAVARESAKAERKLLILDCCYAGKAIRSVPGEPTPLGGKRGWYVMAATSEEDTALGESGRETTFFTGALLKAFEGVKETRASLSPQWVFDAASKMITGSGDTDTTKLVPHQSTATWADQPWLRNRLHIPAPTIPHTYPSDPPGTASPQPPLPDGFRAWPAPEANFTGRTEELAAALGRFGQRSVLPVHGPRYAGKSAFVRQLLAAPGVKDSAPTEQPWLLLEIAIINASAESPVLEALASALEIRLQHVDQNSEADGDPRRELVIDRLREHARGRTLLLVIDCGRLGYDSDQISGELDQLLAHPYFRDTANIFISRVDISDHLQSSDEQLDHKIPVRLAELQPKEAAELLTVLMAHERVTVNGDDVLSRIQDRRLHLPGVLKQGAKGYLRRIGRGPDRPDPATVATALLEGVTPSVAKALRELDCCLSAVPDAPRTPEPLAILAVWALADQLPLAPAVLEHPSVGFPSATLDLLEDAGVLSGTASGRLILGQSSERALRELVLAALTRSEDQKNRHVQPLGVAPELLKDLFPAELDLPELDRRLCVAAFPLFTVAETADAEESADSVFRMRLRSVLGWIEDEGSSRLRALHEVIRPLVLAPSGDALYPPTSADDLVLPTVAVGPEHEATALARLYRLYHSAATLTLAARADSPPSETGARFVGAAQEFSSALADCEPEQVPHTLLRSADTSLALTGKRLRLRTRLLDVRLTAVDVLLLGARRRGPGQAGRITLAVSWLLNTADALVDADRLDEAQELVGKSDALVADALPHDGTPRSVHSRLQLSSRIAQVRSRVVPDPAQSRRELVDAVRNVISGMELAHEQCEPLSLWSMRLFETAILLLQQSSTDEELVDTRSLVLDTLERCWGGRRSWPSSICISAARFLRKVHVRCSDPALNQNGAQEAVELLAHLPAVRNGEVVEPAGGTSQPSSEPGRGIPSLSDRETANVLSSTAQAYGFLARTLRENQRFGAARARLAKAEEFARAAVELAPTAFSYSVWLRQILDVRRAAPPTGAAREEAEKQRRVCVKAVRNWLGRKDVRSHAHALLDLTCLDSDWFEEGSLRGAAQRPAEDFLQLHPVVQRRLIEAVYRERQQKLKAHRHRYGPSVELCALETRLEREYRRWTGVLDFKVAKDKMKRGIGPAPATKAPQVDNTPLFAIFSEAAALWPGDARLIAAEARLHRYIWNYNEAITRYEYLARTAPNGEIRHAARLSAAEAMLADVEYEVPDRRPDWHARLFGARDHLNAILSRSSRIGLAVVLRERVAIRLGEPVNWEPIDAAFETVVGGNYAGTVGRFLDRRHYGEGSSPDRVGDRVRITTKGGAEPPEQSGLRELLDEFFDGHADHKGTSGATSDSARDNSPRLSARDNFASKEDLGQYTSELLGELLLTDFTSAELLGGFGKLYLDRAVDLITRHHTMHGSDPAPDSSTAMDAAGHVRRAYVCFDACRVLQEAHGAESIVTKFERGRAITLAAKFVSSQDPFPQSLLEGRGPQIRQAFFLLHAAREHSVSRFNAVCSIAARENNEVQRCLGLR
ncbi:caspase family protein [Streptomyces sp. WI03-5b]|uniref:caspase family protein n=1 Tax=Streptomyces sp. WI03-5b TaxID=462946 RepID=UPI0029BE8133|nr:caspase family protein [Streptomyces sp. WI03-5b]MDX2622696.1 caspase family protein [Streptomyces sp. WI03-5b]